MFSPHHHLAPHFKLFINVVKLCGRLHFSNPEFVFYCSKRLKVCISDKLHLLMSTMKDTCIAVCCAFYCTCLVLSFYCTCVVLSLTNVCEMPTLWEGITSMGASIASVNRQIVFKQHLEIETCSSQSFFFYQTSTLDSH